MAIARNRYGFEGEISFQCDGCEVELHTEIDSFPDALAMMKREGWKARKVAGEWLHLCPTCDEKS